MGHIINIIHCVVLHLSKRVKLFHYTSFEEWKYVIENYGRGIGSCICLTADIRVTRIRLRTGYIFCRRIRVTRISPR